MNQANTTIMKNLQDYRDGAVTDFALFQKKIQGNMKQSLTTIMTENTTKLEAKLDATVIEYNARVTVKTEDIKQVIKTALFRATTKIK